MVLSRLHKRFSRFLNWATCGSNSTMIATEFVCIIGLTPVLVDIEKTLVLTLTSGKGAHLSHQRRDVAQWTPEIWTTSPRSAKTQSLSYRRCCQALGSYYKGSVQEASGLAILAVFVQFIQDYLNNTRRALVTNNEGTRK